MEARNATAQPAQKPEPIAVNPDGIPDYLKERPQWIVWRYEPRDGKYTKVPYNPWSAKRASSTDLLTWSTFEAAYTVFRSDTRYQGVGFVFCSGDPFAGIDLERLDEELVVRLSAKGKKLVRQKAPRRQRRNLEEFQRRGA